MSRVKTLHTAYRVTDLATSLHFYAALGYEKVGRIDIGAGASLTVLKFPGEDVVTLGLVHQPADVSVDLGTGFSHIVVQVENLASTVTIQVLGVSFVTVGAAGSTLGTCLLRR